MKLPWLLPVMTSAAGSRCNIDPNNTFPSQAGSVKFELFSFGQVHGMDKQFEIYRQIEHDRIILSHVQVLFTPC